MRAMPLRARALAARRCSRGAARVRRRAAGRSRRRALSPLRGRRRHHSRPLGAGAQEDRRELRGVRPTTTSTWSRARRSTWSSTASPYKEERTQKSVSFDYLRGKSTYSVGIINSKESDYTADTAFFSISQDMFGDLTTVSLSYKRGWNDIFRNVKHADGSSDPRSDVRAQAPTRAAMRSASRQILTRNLILALNYEVLTDEGFLNSPYRSVRFVDPTRPTRLQPRERDLSAHAHQQRGLGAAAATTCRTARPSMGSYRFFSDTWGVNAHTASSATRIRRGSAGSSTAACATTSQTAADFYSDLFPRRNFANFMARDKELVDLQRLSRSASAPATSSRSRASPGSRRARRTCAGIT